ncbi:MAG: formate/nitrite transporter family protein [Anaerolineales bacterium]|nr:formate/nitrite transporter family protein [Anaerolineales bacterium]
MFKPTTNNTPPNESLIRPAANYPPISIDALMPPEMAVKAEDIGVKKARMGWRNLFALAVLAGAFIALGGIFATTLTGRGRR